MLSSKNIIYKELTHFDKNKKLISLRIPQYLINIVDDRVAANNSLEKAKKTDRSKMIVSLLEDTMSFEIDVQNGWMKLNKLSPADQIKYLERIIPEQDLVEIINAAKNFDPSIKFIAGAVKEHFEEVISSYFVTKS